MSDLPDGFDLDQLLTPFPGDAPAGADLREDFTPQSPYYRLRDSRSEARAAERALDAGGGEEVTPPQAQWRAVRDVSLRTLAERSKDLEVASWLTESLVRSDGLRGLTAGARLIGGLAERFWDDGLFPMPDEDGMPTRLAPVAGLNGEGGGGTLIQPLRKLELFLRPDREPLLFFEYEEAETVATLPPAARQARLDRMASPFTLEDVEGWARAAGPARFVALRRELDVATQAWTEMGAVLDAKAGADSPPTSHVRDLLDLIRRAVNRFAPPETPGAAIAEAAPAGVAGAAEAPPATGVAAGGPGARAATREDMLAEVTRIAAWFRAAEPHSPLAYTLEEAVRRGRMSWPDLLAELVGDVSARNAILSSLGIKPPAGEEY